MNKQAIPGHMRQGQIKKLAAIQVLAEELGAYYQKQERLTSVEVAQMQGILRNLGTYAQKLMEASITIQEAVKPGK